MAPILRSLILTMLIHLQNIDPQVGYINALIRVTKATFIHFWHALSAGAFTAETAQTTAEVAAHAAAAAEAGQRAQLAAAAYTSAWQSGSSCRTA